MAMQGILAGYYANLHTAMEDVAIANLAYRYADEMVKRRDQDE
ncbi:MAG: hypothetical protein U5K75_10655 [Ahrensia sp.]|nr:hypothetical protein [Ahrensia sp.]